MAYRYGNRGQMQLFPQSIENYVNKDDSVRVYDVFVDALNFKELGIHLDDKKVGNCEYDPKAMLKLLVYSYSYGWRSSRKIERAIYHNVSFMWLMGGLKPDHKTIAEFRRNHKRALQKILKQCVRMCVKLNLIDGNVLFTDGTKIRAAASRNKNYTKEHYKKILQDIDVRIEKLLETCEETDSIEENTGSHIQIKKELTNKENLRQKIQACLAEFKKEDKKTKTVNLTDPESKIMKSIQGSHAAYNVQSVVDEKNGLVVQTQSTNASTDHSQLSTQTEQAEQNTEKKCKTMCADAGYSDADDLAKLDKKDIKVIVPTQEQASEKETKPFNKKEFAYDEKQDKYTCPEGHTLRKSTYDKKENQFIYRIISKKLCKNCNSFGLCTKDKKGRTISRLFNEKTREKIVAQFETETSQRIYARRKERVEHPFGHIKRNLRINQFLLRGAEGTGAEISIASACFNIVRMIKLFGGVNNTILKVKALNC